MWKVSATDEYLFWFEQQDDKSKESILTVVFLLQEFGPQLKRPYSDTLKGSKIKNLKELRIRTAQNVFRILYYFDAKQNALLLVGGDKKGKNQKDFYKKLIKKAEALIMEYDF